MKSPPSPCIPGLLLNPRDDNHTKCFPLLRRFINEIVLEEESDEGLPDASGQKTGLSHFELYCQVMRGIGVDDGKARTLSPCSP